MKKRFIGLTFFLISILTFCQKANPELTKYVDFLEKQNVSAKDYVLDLFKKYDDISNDYFFYFDGYEAKKELIDFVRTYYIYSFILESDYFDETDKEVLEERKEMYYGDECFITEEFTKKEQVEKRIKEAKPLFNLILGYLKKLNIGLMGELKTDEEMDKEYGEYCVFRQERSRF